MRRRDFMTVLAGAVAYPLLAGAQQKATLVIGYLDAGSAGLRASLVAAGFSPHSPNNRGLR